MNNRAELKQYAKTVCVPLMERTMQRRLTGEVSEINDNQGYFVSWIEGFCRPFWGIGPLIRDGESLELTYDGKTIDAVAWIHEVLTAAVDPSSEYQWIYRCESIDEIGYANQIKTELTGMLAGLYVARTQLWEPLPLQVKQQLAGWMFEINKKAFLNCWANNHYWFCILNFLILKKLGFSYPETDTFIAQGLEKINRMYVGGGWYQDGEFGRFDYYNPWAFHLYSMLWTWITAEDQACEEQNREFVQRTQEFLKLYPYWFDVNGCNLPFGRSLSYRYAAGAVFPAAALAGCEMDYGMARRLMLKNIDFYKEQELLSGSPFMSPGFLYNTTGITEVYTSDNGPYWCAKTFLALLLEAQHPFWSEPENWYPIEAGSYFRGSGCEKIHVVLEGNADSGVTLYNNGIQYFQHNEKRNFFNDIGGTYAKFAYNSRSGFGMSAVDNTSLDNMISLITVDRTMWSHRFGFVDLGVKNGIYGSVQTPFANDKGTTIKTWLIPLTRGRHIRVHKVTLTQPYYIGEGGFSVPLYDDRKMLSKAADEMVISAGTVCSGMKTCSGLELNFKLREIQPGYHLYAPLAIYSYYETVMPCPAGEYVIGACFALSARIGDSSEGTDKSNVMEWANDLRIEWNDGSILVSADNQVYSIDETDSTTSCR